MEFIKYPSLINPWGIQTERDITKLLKSDVLCYATEKIHGSNSSVVLNRKGAIQFAGRNGFIEGEGWKQFKHLRESYSDKLIAELKGFFNFELPQDLSVAEVHAFAEYFGAKVQKTEYDLAKEGKNGVRLFNVILLLDNNTTIVVSRNALEQYVSKEFLTFVVGKGTLKELLEIGPKDSSVYGGYSEGIVIQPFFGGQTVDSFLGVKYKTLQFIEVQRISPKTKIYSAASPEEEKLIIDLESYITENRLDNILSYGEIELSAKNIGALMAAMKQDIKKEFIYDGDLDIKEVLNNRAISAKIARTIKHSLGMI